MDTQYLENLSLAIEIIILGMGTVFSSLAFFAFTNRTWFFYGRRCVSGKDNVSAQWRKD
jgi:hypothetical protein